MPLSSSVDNIYGGSTWHGNDITGLGYQTIAGNCIEYKPPLSQYIDNRMNLLPSLIKYSTCTYNINVDLLACCLLYVNPSSNIYVFCLALICFSKIDRLWLSVFEMSIN